MPPQHAAEIVENDKILAELKSKKLADTVAVEKAVIREEVLMILEEERVKAREEQQYLLTQMSLQSAESKERELQVQKLQAEIAQLKSEWAEEKLSESLNHKLSLNGSSSSPLRVFDVIESLEHSPPSASKSSRGNGNSAGNGNGRGMSNRNSNGSTDSDGNGNGSSSYGSVWTYDCSYKFPLTKQRRR